MYMANLEVGSVCPGLSGGLSPPLRWTKSLWMSGDNGGRWGQTGEGQRGLPMGGRIGGQAAGKGHFGMAAGDHDSVMEP